jgi:hypothetical protein
VTATRVSPERAAATRIWPPAGLRVRGERLFAGRRPFGDRGSESVELAILAPIAILVLTMLVVGARVSLAGDRISGVAGIAARDASLARSAGAAQQAANTAATAALAGADLHCTNVRVHLDTSGFSRPPGAAASLRVDVWCTVDLSDIGVPGLPGSKTLTDTAISPLDPARDLS